MDWEFLGFHGKADGKPDEVSLRCPLKVWIQQWVRCQGGFSDDGSKANEQRVYHVAGMVMSPEVNAY
jgi:hypothetical protein